MTVVHILRQCRPLFVNTNWAHRLAYAAAIVSLLGPRQRPASAVITTWAGPSGGSWSASINWSNGEPLINVDTVFPSSRSGNVVLSLNEAARTLTFRNDYTLGS